MTTVYPVTRETYKSFTHNGLAYWVGLGTMTSCPAPVITPISYTSHVIDSVTLGASPADYRRLIAAGNSATSGLEGVRHFGYSRPGMYQYWRPDKWKAYGPCQEGGYAGSLEMLSFPAANFLLNPDADLKARQKFLQKVLDARKTWRGGNFMAEVVETIHMFKHPLKGLEGAVKSLSRAVSNARLAGDASNVAKHIGNAWLEFSFGVKPFFEDIQDANKAIDNLANTLNSDTKRISVTGVSTTATKPSFQPISFLGGVAGTDTQQEFWSKSTGYVKYVGALKARPSGLTQILDSFGFDPGDILPAVWEAIPWSFFIDYFLNVQEQLDSMQFGYGDFGWINKGVRNVVANYAGTVTAVSPSLSQLYEIDISGFARCSSTEYKLRSAISAPPFPAWHFRLPGLGSLKWVNTAALAAQIFGSRSSAR